MSIVDAVVSAVKNHYELTSREIGYIELWHDVAELLGRECVDKDFECGISEALQHNKIEVGHGGKYRPYGAIVNSGPYPLPAEIKPTQAKKKEDGAKEGM